jgi:hypothetical protein
VLRRRHDLDQLVLGIVDARHVGERELGPGLEVVAARLAAAQAHHSAEAHSAGLDPLAGTSRRTTG